MSIHNNEPKYILSLAGGGFRGLFTAEFLTLLEAQTGPLRERVHLVVGTSVGGIIGVGIAAGLTADRIRDAMVQMGRQVFPPERVPLRGLIKQIIGSRRDPEPLRKALVDMVGEQTLGGAPLPAIVTAVDLTAGKPRIFKPSRMGGRDDDLKLVDIALASAAAPTYFPPHTIGSKIYADGGLFANAPDLTAAVEALRSTAWRADRLRLICIGATQSNTALASTKETSTLTGIEWGVEGVFLQQFMASQVRYARECAERLIGEDRYFAIDPMPSPAQQRVLGLDKAEDGTMATLRSLAEDAFEEFLKKHGTLVELLKVAAQ